MTDYTRTQLIFDNLPNDELTISADDLPNISNDNEISL